MANNARTVEDLERKYDFASLLGLSKNIKMNEKSITKVNTELNNFITSATSRIDDLDSQLDGKISTWYYSGEPTLNNLPAKEWAADNDKLAHVGDLYYDKTTGYTYIFEYADSTYKWVRIKDEDIAQAMSLANSAQDTADNKRQVFISQPTTPYSCGDLWISSNEIFICQIERLEGDFNAGDWINNLKYTDNTYAQAIVDELGGTTTKVLEGTVTQYSKGWVKYTDLATGGSTTINGSNIKTGTINTDDVTIGNGNVQMNKDGIKLKNGAKVVGENGLMNTYLFTNNNFEFCGFAGDDPIGWANTSVIKVGPSILFNIPEGLNITSAKVILFHAPTYAGGQRYIEETDTVESFRVWGYCRNLKLYKANNVNSRKYEYDLASELRETNDTEYIEITGAFGNSGWTATTPSDSIHNTERTTSIDIKNSISVGLNELKIQPGDESTPSTNPQDIAAKSSFVYIMVKIDGYMSYNDGPTGVDKAIDIVTKNYANEGELVYFERMQGNNYIIRVSFDAVVVGWYIVNGETWEVEEY